MTGGKEDVGRNITIAEAGVWLSRFVLSLLVPLILWFGKEINSKLADLDKWQRGADTKLAIIEGSTVRTKELLVEVNRDIKDHERRMTVLEHGCCGKKQEAGR